MNTKISLALKDLPICVPTDEIHIQTTNPIQAMLFLSYAKFLYSKE
jgi:hypothetical protein